MDAAPAKPRSVKPANARGVARLAAVQALYQMDMAGTTLPDALSQFERFRLSEEVDGWAYRPADKGYFRHLVSGVVEHQAALDRAIQTALPDAWPLTRIDKLLRAILRAGAFELRQRGDIPTPIVINEFLDVARAFYDDVEVRLTNGVLENLAARFRTA